MKHFIKGDSISVLAAFVVILIGAVAVCSCSWRTKHQSMDSKTLTDKECQSADFQTSNESNIASEQEKQESEPGSDNAVPDEKSGASMSSMLDTVDFCCLGEGIDRPENFDKCPVDVTDDNIRQLYRKYEVEMLEGTDLYLVKSDRLYTTSRYLNRLIKMQNSKQVAARTYYGWDVMYAFRQGDKYMIGLNSLITTAGYENHSTFTCKTVLLDSKLNTIREREFRNKEDWYEYVAIQSLTKVSNGYDFVVVNIGFDQDDYYEYRGHLSNENVVTSSSKTKKKWPRQRNGEAYL